MPSGCLLAVAPTYMPETISENLIATSWRMTVLSLTVTFASPLEASNDQFRTFQRYDLTRDIRRIGRGGGLCIGGIGVSDSQEECDCYCRRKRLAGCHLFLQLDEVNLQNIL